MTYLWPKRRVWHRLGPFSWPLPHRLVFVARVWLCGCCCEVSVVCVVTRSRTIDVSVKYISRKKKKNKKKRTWGSRHGLHVSSPTRHHVTVYPRHRLPSSLYFFVAAIVDSSLACGSWCWIVVCLYHMYCTVDTNKQQLRCNAAKSRLKVLKSYKIMWRGLCAATGYISECFLTVFAPSSRSIFYLLT
jgi:hypothetical protein